MSTPLTPADTYHATIAGISDGEKAKALVTNRPHQEIADNVERLNKTLEHIADVPRGGARTTDHGAKRIRRVAGPPSGLTALSMSAANDKEFFFVENYGLYVYLHGNASAVDGTFRVTHASGRFHWLGNDLRGTAPGLPWIDSAGRLNGPTEIANTIVKIQHDSAGQSDVAEAAAIGSTASASFSDCTADAIYTITGIKSGDQLSFTFRFNADVEDATAATAVGIVALFAGQSGSFTELDRCLVNATFDRSPGLIVNRRGFTLTGKYTAVSAADVVVKLRVRVGSTTNTPTVKVYRPCSCETLVMRP
jgi:hypothetical protein